MSREQRASDNHGLICARQLSLELGARLEVVYCLMPTSGAASRRSYEFMLTGLAQVEQDLRELGIAFDLVIGRPESVLASRLSGAAAVICDFSPLRRQRGLRESLAHSLPCPLIEVDSRNVVPAWIAADKRVSAARYMRPRLSELLPIYLSDFDEVTP